MKNGKYMVHNIFRKNNEILSKDTILITLDTTLIIFCYKMIYIYIIFLIIFLINFTLCIICCCNMLLQGFEPKFPVALFTPFTT